MTRLVQRGRGAPLDGRAAGSADAAHAAALRLLTTRARTRGELRQRLEQRGFEAAAVAEAVARLERVGLVDDAALAETVAEGRAELDAPAIAAEPATAGSTRRSPSGPPRPPSRPPTAPTAAARSPRPASPSSPTSPPRPSSDGWPATWPAAATRPTSPSRSPATWSDLTEGSSSIRSSVDGHGVARSPLPIARRTSAFTGSLWVPSPRAMNEPEGVAVDRPPCTFTSPRVPKNSTDSGQIR